MSSKFKRGDIIISVGGMGYLVGAAYMKNADPRLLPPTKSLYLDSDATAIDEAEGLFDRTLFIGLTGSQVDTIKATPKRFGRSVEEGMTSIAEKHFKRYQAVYGSRTFRVLTLFATAYHLLTIIRTIQAMAIELTKQHNVTRIRPVFVGSTGGGCGSALIVLLSYLFSHPKTRWLLCGGLGEDIFEPIIVFAVDPFTHMHKHQLPHASKIGGNSAAMHTECDMLQHAFCKERSVFNAILHFAFQSSEGVVMSDVEDISRKVSNALIQNQCLSMELASRGTDLFEFRKMDEKYNGDDGTKLGWPHPLKNPFVGPCLFADPRLGEI